MSQDTSSTNTGIQLSVMGSSVNNYGIQSNVSGTASNGMIGVGGAATGSSPTNSGVLGSATGSTLDNTGVVGLSYGDNVDNDGLSGLAYGANSYNTGASGIVIGGSCAGSTNIGVFGSIDTASQGILNVGVEGDLFLLSPTPGVPYYAIYGRAANGGAGGGVSAPTNGVSPLDPSYAGYFEGDVFCSNTYYYSDPKLKENIQDYAGALDQIKKLPVKSYTFKNKEYPTMQLPQGNQVGVLSTDMKTIFPNLVKAAIHPASKTDKQRVDFEAVNYNALIPVLVEAVKELDSKTDQNKQLEQKVADQDNTIRALSDKIDALSACITDICAGSRQTTSVTSATALYQSVPNPTSASTQIGYTVGISFTQADILVNDMNGKQVMDYTITTTGAGSITVNTSAMSAGAYKYSLVIDGKIYDTKTMVVVSK